MDLLPEQVGAKDSFAVEYPFCQYFLDGEPEISLMAVYQLERLANSTVQVLACVTDQIESIANALADNGVGFNDIAQQYNLAVVNISAPLLLKTVAIPKPWGQEIWYTGIEERGQSAVVDQQGREIPLSWLFSLAPGQLTANRERSINLLKILDPLPEEVYGDLYFELHEEKREVYVVTNVDQTAWPDGEGAIRFGFDQNVRADYSDDDAFRLAYLKAVENYEEVRREIDGLFDQQRQQQGIALDAPVNAEQLKSWHSQLPAELQAEEASRREQMNRFTAIRKLQLGDVVKVPCFTPHALQHGVRTVEFQTPVYERRILSFAQKVLTQGHWDTQDAIGMMDLDAPLQEDLKVIEQSDAARLETVVRFDDFEVFRLTLAPGASWQMNDSEEYALVMKIAGAASCANLALGEEQAAFLPARRDSMSLQNPGKQDAVLLLAQPR